MDLDNITDIELLRSIAKSYMIQMKKDTNANDGTDYIFKEGYWYFFRSRRNWDNGLYGR